MPILVLDGAEEELIKPAHTRRLAELIPGSQLVLIPDTGHFAPIAKPGAFNQIVLDFLQGNHVEQIEDVMRREIAAARTRGAQ